MVSGLFGCSPCGDTYRLYQSAEALPTKRTCPKCGAKQKPRAEYKAAMKRQSGDLLGNVSDTVRRKILGDYLFYLAIGVYGKNPVSRGR